ncbi:hypothetical protein, partial [Escherichia coli]|uniref:hypothetical protein n=1 Tax=Escherichia coli TaxID=562 RepID=UPI001ABC1554
KNHKTLLAPENRVRKHLSAFLMLFRDGYINWCQKRAQMLSNAIFRSEQGFVIFWFFRRSECD